MFIMHGGIWAERKPERINIKNDTVNTSDQEAIEHYTGIQEALKLRVTEHTNNPGWLH